MREVRQGQFYRHFKDRMYQVIAVAEHSETGERMVVYQALYGEYRIFVRPYEMFVSEVDHEKYPQVTQRYRFELTELTGGQAEEHPVKVTDSEKEVFCDLEDPGTGTEENGHLEDPGTGTEKNGHMEDSGTGTEENGHLEDPGTGTEENGHKKDREFGNEEKDPVTEDETVNPLLLEFLDADTLEEKMHIMIFGRNQMDDNLLNSIAISLDLVVEEKSTEEKYDEILNCLAMKERFECSRLR